MEINTKTGCNIYIHYLIRKCLLNFNILMSNIIKIYSNRDENNYFIFSIKGAVFIEDQKNSCTELAFKYAVHRINRNKNILPGSMLAYDIEYVPRGDSFHASKKGKII